MAFQVHALVEVTCTSLKKNDIFSQIQQHWLTAPVFVAHLHRSICDLATQLCTSPPKRKAITLNWSSGLTCEVALDPQVAHAEPKDRQLVQAGANVVAKGQQVRQPVQLHVQPIPVALRRVGLDHRISFGGGLLPDG